MNDDNDTPKKAKKQAKKKALEVKNLAKDILEDVQQEEDTIDNPDMPQIVEDDKIYEDIPDSKLIAPPVEPIRFDGGLSKMSAFPIYKRIEEMHTILGKYFGSKNGDYFVSNENTSTSYNKENQRKRYRCVIVEDKNGYTYTLWFDITNIGPVY